MKRRGYTLLELIIVISILMIIMGLTGKVFMGTRAMISKMELSSVFEEISSLLSLGKEYSFIKEHRTRVEVSKKNNTLRLIDEDLSSSEGVIKTIILPKGYEFLENYNIPISINGVISANSIWIKDTYGKYHRITIAVGVDLISIYEEEK